jgi:hypothetical protein
MISVCEKSAPLKKQRFSGQALECIWKTVAQVEAGGMPSYSESPECPTREGECSSDSSRATPSSPARPNAAISASSAVITEIKRRESRTIARVKASASGPFCKIAVSAEVSITMLTRNAVLVVAYTLDRCTRVEHGESSKTVSKLKHVVDEISVIRRWPTAFESLSKSRDHGLGKRFARAVSQLAGKSISFIALEVQRHTPAFFPFVCPSTSGSICTPLRSAPETWREARGVAGAS